MREEACPGLSVEVKQWGLDQDMMGRLIVKGGGCVCTDPNNVHDMFNEKQGTLQNKTYRTLPCIGETQTLHTYLLVMHSYSYR